MRLSWSKTEYELRLFIPVPVRSGVPAMSSLAKRILTAAVLIPLIVVALLVLPPAAAVAAVSLFLIVAAWEWPGFLGWGTLAGRAAYVLIIVLGALVVVQLEPAWLLYAALAWWVLALLWVMRYPTPIPPAVTFACGLFVLLPPWVAVAYLLLHTAAGGAALLAVLAVVWAADIGAYFAGRGFGRKRLAPAVSPGKTWEGVIGGVACATATSIAAGYLLGWPIAACIAIGISIALISVIGDLTVSMFKRNAGLKDSGNLFPGHGGVLDRVDGVTAALPLFVLEFWWFGLAPA